MQRISSGAFEKAADIGTTGANLEKSAANLVKNELGDNLIASFDVKLPGNQGFDFVYVKNVNGTPQLVIGEAKAGDSALSALGENRVSTLNRNLNEIKVQIQDSNLSRDVKNSLLEQVENKTFQVELYTSANNAAKTASRFDDSLIKFVGSPTRVIQFPVK
jgi:filamentous hemagglutinin